LKEQLIKKFLTEYTGERISEGASAEQELVEKTKEMKL